ncbi:MAG: aminotransferase class V-fold PLP-dependent enzyme, partial [Planctomycetes bacterium]|nr:aminotransferase class V-fold PLP-dependent enzyme [Planctomycetota bacterium]
QTGLESNIDFSMQNPEDQFIGGKPLRSFIIPVFICPSETTSKILVARDGIDSAISNYAGSIGSQWMSSWSGCNLATIVGAFAAGLILEGSHYRELGERENRSLEDAIAPLSALLVPIFFVQMGIQVDLMSFSSHKIYGPKGIGALYIRRSRPAVRLEAQLLGGGHEGGMRSGTLNTPGIVGFAKALELCLEEMPAETERLRTLRNRLYEGLTSSVDGTHLNGPALEKCDLRLAGNLNLSFNYVDGEALLMSTQNLALSSGSACTSAEPEPSQVLKALGLSDDRTRSSIRFGLGRFNTLEEVQFAINTVHEAVERLRKFSGMA